jgi:hypothetical protein
MPSSLVVVIRRSLIALLTAQCIVGPSRALAQSEPQTAPAPSTETVPDASSQGGPIEPPPNRLTTLGTATPFRPMARIGYFVIGPTGPGNYSLRDALLGETRSGPPKTPYPPVLSDGYSFYDADYRYLDSPGSGQTDCLTGLKRMRVADDWTLSVGGEERVRFMDENGGYSRFTGTTNVYELTRSRVYGDLWYRDRFRLYAEMQDSRIGGNSLPPLGNDVDHADLLNLFVDAKLFSVGNQPAYARLGRQELYFGSQRLVGPSDFPNVRRTFQGVRTFWLGEKWSVDAFWVQPVLMRATTADPPDHNQNFSGAWATYRPREGQAVDFYYLDLDNRNPGVAVGRDGAVGGYNVSTFGTRYAGDANHYLWDFEAMYQFGSWSNQIISAGAVTSGVGYAFAGLPFNPQFWIYNDWASGNQNPGQGNVHGTFNQLFPWGHTYLGYLDLVGRSNIDDLSMQFACYPTKWVLSTIQYHVFNLVSARDGLYNSSGTVIRSDPTGRAGRFVGQEIDLTTNFHLSLHQDLYVGYSVLFAGSFIRNTAGPQADPSLFYVQYSFKW